MRELGCFGDGEGLYEGTGGFLGEVAFWGVCWGKYGYYEYR